MGALTRAITLLVTMTLLVLVPGSTRATVPEGWLVRNPLLDRLRTRSRPSRAMARPDRDAQSADRTARASRPRVRRRRQRVHVTGELASTWSTRCGVVRRFAACSAQKSWTRFDRRSCAWIPGCYRLRPPSCRADELGPAVYESVLSSAPYADSWRMFKRLNRAESKSSWACGADQRSSRSTARAVAC